MNITEIKYGHTFNKGDYASERIDATCGLAPEDSPVEALKNLKAFVHYGQWEDGKTVTLPASENKTASGEETQVSEVKPKKAATKKTAAEVAKEETKEEVVAQEKTTPVATEETKAETEPKKKGLRVKATVYDRNNDTHKKLLGEELDKLCKANGLTSWRETPSLKEKAGGASRKMVGVGFLDGEGLVFTSFREELTKAFTGK